MMLGIDVYAFARMIILSLFYGACLGFLHELLRFIFLFFFPMTYDGSSQSRVLSQIIIAIRDIIFFFICSVTFAVFVYYTNNGNIRLFAVIGTLSGFFVFYFSVGRFVRKVFETLIHIFYKLISFLAFPIRRGIKKCFPWIRLKIARLRKKEL